VKKNKEAVAATKTKPIMTIGAQGGFKFSNSSVSAAPVASNPEKPSKQADNEKGKNAETSIYSVGTECYWAPEQKDRKRCSQKSDIYSLGLTFLEIILPRPFSNETLLEAQIQGLCVAFEDSFFLWLKRWLKESQNSDEWMPSDKKGQLLDKLDKIPR
jgi:serine/threonine protein kinase